MDKTSENTSPSELMELADNWRGRISNDYSIIATATIANSYEWAAFLRTIGPALAHALKHFGDAKDRP